MTEKLKECPFCGGDDIAPVSKGILMFFRCQKCRTKGPSSRFSYADAVEKWNTRANKSPSLMAERLASSEGRRALFRLRGAILAEIDTNPKEGSRIYWADRFNDVEIARAEFEKGGLK